MKMQESSTGKFKMKVRLLIPNHNINMYQDVLKVRVYKLPEDEQDFKLADKVYVGCILLKWKQVFSTLQSGVSAVTQFEEELIDPEQECRKIEVSGLLSGELQWIQFGHASSNYNENCEKKDAKKAANDAEGIVNLNFGKEGSLSMIAREAKGDSLDMSKPYQVKFQLKSTSGDKVGEAFSQSSNPKNPNIKWDRKEACYIGVNNKISETSLYIALQTEAVGLKKA